MSILTKMLGAAVLTRGISKTAHFQQLMQGLVKVLLLVIVTGVLIGALVVSGLYAAYLALIAHGLQTEAAFFAIFLLAMIVVCGMVLALLSQFNAIRSVPKQMFHVQAPVVARVQDIAESFVAGIFTPNRQTASRHQKG
jgi:hypothetical protein